MLANLANSVSDKYLGDYIHSAGVSASVDCTISNRYGRIIAGIIETRAIIDDCRVNTVGGLQAGLDYWEIAYLPSLLNNCQTWTNISEETMTKLENIQNMMFRVLLNVPQTCPKPALCWEMGSLQMKFRIISKKLNFLWHLKNLEDSSLANEIFCAQRDADMPGLVKECYELMDNLKLPNILQESISQIQWKSMVKKAIIKANEDELRRKMMSSSKLRTSDMIQEECITKPYVKNLTVTKVTQPKTMKDLRKISSTSDFSKVYESFLKEWIMEDIGPNIDIGQFGGQEWEQNTCLSV